MFQFLIPSLRFWDISVSLICKLHIWRSLWSMTYRRMLYIFVIIKRNHFEVITDVRVSLPRHQTCTFWSDFVHMCNLHIKETEISQKRSKGIKNWKITYSVILSVLSDKINLILGYSSPLRVRAHHCFKGPSLF